MIPFLCLVISVHDGDTLVCRDQGPVRIANIAACETRGRERDPSCDRVQAHVAKARLASLVVRGRVTVSPERPCNWRERRIVGRVLVNGRDVGEVMIGEGTVARFVCRVRR